MAEEVGATNKGEQEEEEGRINNNRNLTHIAQQPKEEKEIESKSNFTVEENQEKPENKISLQKSGGEEVKTDENDTLIEAEGIV